MRLLVAARALRTCERGREVDRYRCQRLTDRTSFLHLLRDSLEFGILDTFDLGFGLQVDTVYLETRIVLPQKNLSLGVDRTGRLPFLFQGGVERHCIAARKRRTEELFR